MLRLQGEHEPDWFSDDGQRLGEVFFRRDGEEFVRSGPRAYFDDVDRLEVGFQLPPRNPPLVRGDVPPADPAQSSLAYIGRIVAFCRSHGIDLRIAITPSHVHQLEISAMLGAGAAAERGKRALALLLDEQPTRRGTVDAGQAIPVWDFSGYSSITTEPLPPVGSNEEMQFYWDSSHFKSIVGDLVLDRVFAIEVPSRPLPSDFGVLLTGANVEEVLAMQRTRQADHRQRARDDLAALRRLVDESAAGAGARPE
jgi:hypothetical protein